MTTYRYRMCTIVGAPDDPDCVCMAQSWASLPGREQGTRGSTGNSPLILSYHLLTSLGCGQGGSLRDAE